MGRVRWGGVGRGEWGWGGPSLGPIRCRTRTAPLRPLHCPSRRVPSAHSPPAPAVSRGLRGPAHARAKPKRQPFGPSECSGCASRDAKASDGIQQPTGCACCVCVDENVRRTGARESPARAPAALSARGRAPASRSRVRPRLHCIALHCIAKVEERTNAAPAPPLSHLYHAEVGWPRRGHRRVRPKRGRRVRARLCVRLGPRLLSLPPSLRPPSMRAVEFCDAWMGHGQVVVQCLW